MDTKLRFRRGPCQAALEALPVAVMEADVDGAILHANACARRLLGNMANASELLATLQLFGIRGAWSEIADRAFCTPLGVNIRFANPPSLSKFGPQEQKTSQLAQRENITVSRKPNSGVNARAVGTSVRAELHPSIDEPAANIPAPEWGVLNVVAAPAFAETKASTLLITLTTCPFVETDPDRIEINRKLSALGRLSAQVAHELNNPLDGILRYINLSLRLVGEPQNPKLKSYLSESRSGLMRVVQIIGELLAHSRATDGEFDDKNVNEIVEEALRTATGHLDGRTLIVAADFQNAGMPRVRGSKLYQICRNLFQNSVDAMPEGGRLLVTTGLVHGEIIIRVSDTGVGLPLDPELLFQPFYTTKELGKGTGLGLAICREYVAAMDGRIEAAAGIPKGAIFTVSIPLSSFPEIKRAGGDRPAI